MQNDFSQIIAELKKPFPPESHKERQLPGGGRWLYITWQDIRERLDVVCPDWQVEWSQATYVGDYCVIQCTIKIAGISRSAPGNAPIQLLSSGGKDMARGTPIERAVADAFKNAAEAFGIGRYLDDQKFVANYLSQKGDMRAYKFAKENEEIEVGARGIPKKLTSLPESNGNSTPISEAQASRLWAIAKNELALTNDDVKAVFSEFKVESTKEIPKSKYEQIIQKLRDYAVV